MLTDERPLSYRINDLAQVAAMTDEELRAQVAEHDAEIAAVIGRSQSTSNSGRVRRLQQSIRVLRLHRSWLADEYASRKKARRVEKQSTVEADAARRREAGHALARELHERGEASRAARIQAANDETRRHFQAFKNAVRAHVGEEVYSTLWAAALRETT